MFGVGEGGVVDVVVVVREVGLVRGVFFVEFDDAICVAVVVGFCGCCVADLVFVHAGYSDVVVELVDGCAVEVRGAVWGDGVAALFGVGGGAVFSGGVFEADVAGAYFDGDAVEEHACVQEVGGGYFRCDEYVSDVDGVAFAFDELDDVESDGCFDDG